MVNKIDRFWYLLAKLNTITLMIRRYVCKRMYKYKYTYIKICVYRYVCMYILTLTISRSGVTVAHIFKLIFEEKQLYTIHMYIHMYT